METNYILGSGVVPQILLAVIIIFVLYVAMLTIDAFNRIYNRMNGSRTELMPYTYSSDMKSYQIKQNPSLPDSKPVFISDNEMTGVEFSYSFYININKNNFNGTEGLMHVFHKGNAAIFPLLSPGVFVKSEKNTLRVYMNSYKTWNNYCDIDNIPIGKWCHCALVYRNQGLEVYINGNLSKKINLADSVPYQNYGDYYFFSMHKLQLSKTTQPCIDTNMNIFGPFKGMLSRVVYYNYAISYSEIQSLMNSGPSDKIDNVSSNGGVPPYLTDNWWIN
jgi:hypothetical protein